MTRKNNDRTPLGYIKYRDSGERTLFVVLNGIPLAIAGVVTYYDRPSDAEVLSLRSDSVPHKSNKTLDISRALVRFYTESKAEFEIYLGRSLHGFDQVTLEMLIEAFNVRGNESPLAHLMIAVASKVNKHIKPGDHNREAQVLNPIPMYAGMHSLILGVRKVGSNQAEMFTPSNPHGMGFPGMAAMEDALNNLEEENDSEGGPPIPFSPN